MKKNFCIFRFNGIWHLRVRVYYENGKEVILKIASKNYKTILRYAWMTKIENNLVILESLILI